MKTLLIATLYLCTFATPFPNAHAEDYPYAATKPYDDGVQVKYSYSVNADGVPVKTTYVTIVDPKDGTGLGVSRSSDGKTTSALITPSIIVERR
jgi:hypothetical protein